MKRIAVGIAALGCLALVLGLPGTLHAAATQVVFTYADPSNNPSVNDVRNYTIQAQDAGGNPVTDYAGPVTLGVYSAIDGTLLDPAALIWNRALGTPLTAIGQAIAYVTPPDLVWSGGTIQFAIQFKTGFDSGMVVAKTAFGPVTLMDFFGVRGFSEPYHLEDADSDFTSGSVYHFDLSQTQTDLLNPDSASVTTAISSVPIPKLIWDGSSLGGSLAFAVTNVTGQYSAGGAGVTVLLYASRDSIPGDAVAVRYAYILDYDGNLVDYDHPDPVHDTFYVSTALFNAPTGSFALAGAGVSLVSGPPVGSVSAMAGGKIILRVWDQSSSANTSRLRVRMTDPQLLSRIIVPFSSSNVLPVRGSIEPKEILTNASNLPLTYVISNLSNRTLAKAVIRIPAGGSSTAWNIDSVDVPAGVSVGVSQAGLVLPGAVTLTWTPPLDIGASATVTIHADAPDLGGSWGFPFGEVLDAGANEMPKNDSETTLTALGAPSAPSYLTAQPALYTGAGGRVSLSWSPVSDQGCNGYILSRRSPAGTGAYSALVTLGSNATVAYDDDTVVNGTSYQYQVTAKNNLTQSSAVASAGVTPFRNPSPVTGLQAYTLNGSVSLAWNPVTPSSGQLPVGGYRIYRGFALNPTTYLTTVTGSSFHDTGAINSGLTYHYRVRTIDDQYSGTPADAHLSDWPASGVQGFPPGYPPTSLAASSDALTVHLTWATPVPGNVGAPVSYVLYRRTGAAPTTAVYDSRVEIPTGTSYDDTTGLSFGSSYHYLLTAQFSGPYESNPSGVAAVTIRPQTPTGLAASPGSAAITLTWNPVDAQGVIDYRLIRQGGGAPVTWIVAYGTNLRVDPSPVRGVDHTYTIESRNAGGYSPASSPITTALAPLAPTSLSATSGTGWAVTLAWPASVSDPNVGYYNVLRDVDPDPTGAVTVGADLTIRSLTDGPLAPGGIYFYFLQFRNAGGVSPLSNPVSLQLNPSAPGGVTAVSAAGAVSVRWNAVLGEGVARYFVYSNPSYPFTPSLANRVQTVTGASVTVFADSLPPGTLRYYLVTADNSTVALVGGESVPGGPASQMSPPDVPTGLSIAVTGANRDQLLLSWSASSGALAHHVYQDGVSIASVPMPASTRVVTLTGQQGVTHRYQIQADNVNGSIGGTSALTSPVTQVLPPQAPGPVTALASGNSISLSWPAILGQGVQRYHIYADSSNPNPASLGVAARQGTVTGTSWSETRAAGDLRYYQVSADNDGIPPGGEGLPSSPVSQMIPPDPPTAVSVTFQGSTNSDARVSWAAPVTQTVLRYLVSRNGGAPVTVDAPATFLVDPGTNGLYGTPVTYTIRSDNFSAATSIGGTGPAVTVTALVPPRPITLTAAGVSAASDTAVTLVWGPEIAQGVTGYAVDRQLDGGTFYRAMTVSGASSASTTVLGNGMRGHVYGYRVLAINAGGEGAAATTLSVAIPCSPTTILTAISGFAGPSARVDLSWIPNPGSEPVTGYRILRSATLSPLSSYVTAGTVDSSTTTFSESGLAEPATLHYLVRAVANGVDSRPNTGYARSVVSYRPPNTSPAPALAPGDASVTLTWSTTGVATSYPVTTWICHVSTIPGVLGAPQTVFASSAASAVTAVSTGLVNGTTYYFRLRALDSSGNLGAAGPETAAMPVIVPGAPFLASINNTTDELSVLWNAGTPGTMPVSVYQVYRTYSPSWPAETLLATVPGWQNAYADNAVTATVNYAYRVRAMDTAGNLSAFSNAMTQALSGSVTLPAPQNLRLTAGDGVVPLDWAPAYDPPPDDIDATAVYRRVGSGAFSAVVTLSDNVTQFVDGGLANGTSYSYFLVSMSGLLLSQTNGSTVQGIPARPPSAPSLAASDGDGYVTLNWNPVAAIDGVPVTGIAVTCSVGGAVTHAAGVTTCTRTGLANGTTVVFSARCVNANGTWSPASAPVTGYPYVLGPPSNPSASITLLTSPVTQAAIRVSYGAPTVSSFPVANYRIYESTTPGSYGAVPATILGASTLAFSFGQNPGDPRRYYVVTAVDDKGHVSARSVEVDDQATTPPRAPSVVRATAGDGLVLVDWTESDPGSLPVSAYVVSRNGTAAATVTAGQTWWVDSPTVNGAPLTYTVTAYDPYLRTDPDAHSSDPTSPVTTASVAGKTNPPTGLSAMPTGETTVLLNWNRPTDLGRAITAYTVLRSGVPMPSVYPVTVATIPVTIDTDTFTYMDSGLVAGTTYHYVVVASDALGTSGFSNEAAVRMPAPGRAVPSMQTGGQALLDRNVVRPMRGEKLGIFFRLDTPADVEIRIYNVAGDLMVPIHYGPAPAGTVLNADWDVKDRMGSWAASGLYLVEIKAGPLHQVRKVAVIR